MFQPYLYSLWFQLSENNVFLMLSKKKTKLYYYDLKDGGGGKKTHFGDVCCPYPKKDRISYL